MTKQTIRFCTGDDDVRIAYAESGEGPPLVKVAKLLSRKHLRQGAEVTTVSYIQSRREHDEARRAIGATFSNVDLLVTPTTAVSSPTIEEAVRLGIDVELIRNTTPFNVYGLPTISIPCGFTRSVLPIGMQISGPRFGEAEVLALAHAYEQTTEWGSRRPHIV